MAQAHARPDSPLTGLLSSLADNWWLLLLRGVAAIAFGILAFFWPGLTLLTLTLLWGIYALADGLLALWAAIAAKGDMAPRWWLGLTGVIGILAGLVAFIYPGTTTLVLLISLLLGRSSLACCSSGARSNSAENWKTHGCSSSTACFRLLLVSSCLSSLAQVRWRSFG
jgi:uncharacterized membrane protein HdeD (DUF308 family)